MCQAFFKMLFCAALYFCIGTTPVYADAQSIQSITAKAERGDPIYQYKLGLIFYLDGSQESKALSLSWIQKAAEQDYSWAQVFLAKIYRDGDDTDINPKLSLHWLSKAIAHGHSGAELMMGQFYMDGFAVEKDMPKAYMWTALSARQGLDAAKNQLTDLSTRMLPGDILAGEQMVRDWEAAQ